jgi:hypothetical protein
MGQEVTDKPRTSRALRVGLLSSGLACAALTLTYLTGSRDLGFGKSISESGQRFLLLIAVLFFAAFAIANLVTLRAGINREKQRLH